MQREVVLDVVCKRSRLSIAKINGVRVLVMLNVRVVLSRRRAIVISKERKQYHLLLIFYRVIYVGIQSMMLSPVMLKVVIRPHQQFDVHVVDLCTTVQKDANAAICWYIPKIAEVLR